MNKFGVAALIFGCSCYLAAADLTRNGQAASEIILENATNSRQLQYAADELANWVGKISNCTIPIKQNSADPTLTKVILGTPISSLKIADFVRNNAEDYAKLKDNDGFIIREIDNNIYIVGSKSKGVLNGVYRFLERRNETGSCETRTNHHGKKRRNSQNKTKRIESGSDSIRVKLGIRQTSRTIQILSRYPTQNRPD